MSVSFLRKPIFVTGLRSFWTVQRNFAETKSTQENSNNSNKCNDKTSPDDEEKYERAVKSKILDASLNFVHELGWSKEAISAGAESIGYAGTVQGMFQGSGADLVDHFYSSCNLKLREILEKEMILEKDEEKRVKKLPESIVQHGIKTRLQMVIPYKKIWPQAMGLMALPQNTPKALSNLCVLIDDICYYAGDRSVDFNWYARRFAVAGIYKTTELYMLQDNSEDHQQTWRFLDNRVSEAVELNKVCSLIPNVSVPETARAVSSTLKNIMGLRSV